MRRLGRFLVAGWLFVLLAALSFGQRADRATITGVVIDNQQAAVPDASVTITDESTGVKTVLTTNEAGAYSSPPLVLGIYSVSVEKTGFKNFVRSGINLVGGQVFRQDATLELGAVTERIEVTSSADMINVSQPDVSSTVNTKYYQDLPVVMGADIRLAESLLYMQPGFMPMAPNGDPMFRGSQFNSRINGGQTMATENFFDGAAFGFAGGHQQTHESAPPIEGIREMRVINSTFSAQYGHTSGGFIEYTSKSGSNEIHGSFYEYFTHEKLKARGFFGERPKTRNNNYGFTFGGPVYIPKIYDGRNKTFVFVNLDWLNFRSGVLPGYANTSPIEAFRNGDFSALLSNTQVGTDALNRPILQGQIFDPGTTRMVNGVPVRDPFPNNQIPAGHPLRSQVAAKLVPLIPLPNRPGLNFNYAGNPAGDQTWVLDARTLLLRADHNFNDAFRSTTSFFWNSRPSIRNCGGLGGCTTEFDGETSPEQNTNYIGEGFYQRIATHHIHQQFDWIIKTNLLNHTTIAYDRWFMGGNPLSAGVGWPERLWGANRGGLLVNDAGPPVMTFSGNIGYNTIGQDWPRFGFHTNNRWQFSNDLTYLAGKHTIKVGFEYRFHQFPYAGWGTAPGGNFNFNRLGTGGYDARGNTLVQTGDPFASFLLGQVNQAGFAIPAFPTWTEFYFSPWFNDDYKVTNNLTLTLGLRFDYQGAKRERFDQFSTFDPATPNPGAGNRLGALIFAGEGQGRVGQRTFEDPPRNAWGPRIGFAYKLGDKSVIRGGYGIYYSGISFDQFATQPTVGFAFNPFAPNLTNGLEPAFYLDRGIPSSVVRIPPFIDPAFANGTSPVAVARDGLTLPRYQNWSLTVQREIAANLGLDVSYIANRGTRLLHHGSTLGVASNMNDPQVLQLGSAVLGADINSPAAQAAGIAAPYPGFRGNVARALRPYPQYEGINWRHVPTGMSEYHSLQTKIEKRFSSGLQFRAAYTWSKLLNNGAESGQGGNGDNAGVQNPLYTLEWAVSQDDVPHSFLTAFSWELPFRRQQQGFAGKILGGWNISGILRYDSGRPLAITMANDLGGFLFNGQKRPSRVADGSGKAEIEDFDPGRDRYFNRSAWYDPGPLQFGNAPPRDGNVRGFPNLSEDLSFFKDIRFYEKYKFRLEGQFGNIFNRVVFCNPDQNWSAGSFGQVFSQCNTPRSVQFGLRFDY
jgi:hypothetical protein